MPRVRGVNYSPSLHLLMRKRRQAPKAFAQGTVVLRVCVEWDFKSTLKPDLLQHLFPGAYMSVKDSVLAYGALKEKFRFSNFHF